MKGYVGKILRVNLSTQKISKDKLSKSFAKKFLGGTGFCAKLLYDELPLRANPLGKENIFILATGPVTGTLFPPSGRCMVASKSPLTNIWCESHSGGFFGPELKYAGYDLLIITGRAPKPVYIQIKDDLVNLRDAKHLWGRGTSETTDIINEEIGECRVACIGPAGENLVKFACLINDKHRAAGRGGLGAVLGSKNLKAIAIKGTGGIEAYDLDAFMRVIEAARSKFTTGVWGITCQASLGTVGTTGLVEAAMEIGRLPTKNHYSGIFEYYEEIGSAAIRKKIRKKRKSCFCCGIQCKYISVINDGKYKGTLCEGPEYETIFALGPNCFNRNLESIIHANMLCNNYGLDTISLGKSISFAMECYENGILAEKVKWGDYEKIIELIHKIARREGIGNLLAEGVKRAAAKLGKGAERFAMHVKGMESSGQDGRPHKSIGLAHAISVRGADHLRAISSLDELGFDDIVKKRYGKIASDILEIRSVKGKGALIADMEELYAIVDSLIICKYGTMWPPVLYFDDFIKIIPPLTGFKEYSDLRFVRKTAKRICLLRRAFNARLGITRKDDVLPKRMLYEPMPSGPAKGEVVDLQPMLNDFYKYRGCTENGIPSEEALRKVDLNEVAKDLKSRGLYASR